MVSVPTVEEIQKVLDDGNREMDEEVTKKFLNWALTYMAFRNSEQVLPQDEPLETFSADKENMDFLSWCCQGQFIGVWDKYQSGDDRLEFGLLGTEPAIIYPWRIKFKTYGPEGEKLSYRISRREGLRVCQSDVNITLQTLRSSIHRIKVFVGDEAVERVVMGIFAISNEDYINILGQYRKSPKLILPEDDGGFIGYG